MQPKVANRRLPSEQFSGKEIDVIKVPRRMRQVMDWRAALWAGIIAGAVFLIAQMVLLSLLAGGSPWVVPRRIAAIVLGEAVLSPPAFSLSIVLVALLVHFFLSVVYALILAFIIHRWGMIVGIVGGALFGLALYVINFYTFSILFPWFFPVRSWIDVFTHMLFGAVAGGVYEALEVEEFVPVET